METAQRQPDSHEAEVARADIDADPVDVDAKGARHRGKTFISDEVVSVIAQIAAKQIEGVHQIGESSFRTLLARLSRHHGIDSEVGMKEAAVDIDVVVEFGYPIRDVAQRLREQVIDSVQRMTSRRVVEVNVNVIDVHVPKNESHGRRRLE